MTENIKKLTIEQFNLQTIEANLRHAELNDDAQSYTAQFKYFTETRQRIAEIKAEIQRGITV